MRTGLLATIVAALLIGFPLAGFAGPVGVDPDGDGIDNSLDNCTEVANGAPLNGDRDQDGFGNVCDCDMNSDGICDTSDLAIFRAALISGAPADPSNPVEDMNDDGVVDTSDLGLFRPGLIAGAPGPSGLACAGNTVPCP